eukprot:COSAG02_NODE_2517_length_8617_cov_4.605893_7_plen_89_part_00
MSITGRSGETEPMKIPPAPVSVELDRGKLNSSRPGIGLVLIPCIKSVEQMMRDFSTRLHDCCSVFLGLALVSYPFIVLALSRLTCRLR